MAQFYESKYRPHLKGRFANMHNEVKIPNTSDPYDSATVRETARKGRKNLMANVRAFADKQIKAKAGI